mmetsp:Transcript_12289/g.44809  ORF Transcript_12289/g.44809 Transcript_12289/m.44809 type:complete len:217 (-) Transcript_12289:1330-1980(-)
MSTLPVSVLTYPKVCIIQFSSSRSVKSSRACAPRDSLRCSAECIVMAALVSKFSSSRVSIKSVFHTRPRSLIPTPSRKLLYTSSMSSQPSARVSCVRKTAALFCMTRCILVLSSAVDSSPLAWRSLSMRSRARSVESDLTSLILSPGFDVSAILLAQARPNTTMSKSEFAPRRFAPCTDALDTSPAAKRPGITWSGLPSLTVTTSPWWFVGTPPML